jgi:flagellar protein FliS
MSTGTLDRYRQMDVAAMTPAQRIVALYARLVLSFKPARLAIDTGDIVAREQRLDHAAAILHELAASLDRQQGGEIAERLAALYTWLIGECLQIHLAPEPRRLDAVITITQELHQAWADAARQIPVAQP